MAGSISAPSPNGRVELLTAEGLISMKDAAKLYGRKTHKSTPTRHHLNGVQLANGTTVKLEAIRVSGSLRTSREAVLRFFAAQQDATVERQPAAPTPKQRATAATKARAELAEKLGAKT